MLRTQGSVQIKYTQNTWVIYEIYEKIQVKKRLIKTNLSVCRS